MQRKLQRGDHLQGSDLTRDEGQDTGWAFKPPQTGLSGPAPSRRTFFFPAWELWPHGPPSLPGCVRGWTPGPGSWPRPESGHQPRPIRPGAFDLELRDPFPSDTRPVGAGRWGTLPAGSRSARRHEPDAWGGEQAQPRPRGCRLAPFSAAVGARGSRGLPGWAASASVWWVLLPPSQCRWSLRAWLTKGRLFPGAEVGRLPVLLCCSARLSPPLLLRTMSRPPTFGIPYGRSSGGGRGADGMTGAASLAHH